MKHVDSIDLILRLAMEGERGRTFIRARQTSQEESINRGFAPAEEASVPSEPFLQHILC